MSLSDVLSAIEAEIALLQQVRSLLTDSDTDTRANKSASTRTAKVKRVLSPEARKRIADAQRKRWAAQKRVAK